MNYNNVAILYADGKQLLLPKITEEMMGLIADREYDCLINNMLVGTTDKVVIQENYVLIEEINASNFNQQDCFLINLKLRYRYHDLIDTTCLLLIHEGDIAESSELKEYFKASGEYYYKDFLVGPHLYTKRLQNKYGDVCLRLPESTVDNLLLPDKTITLNYQVNGFELKENNNRQVVCYTDFEFSKDLDFTVNWERFSFLLLDGTVFSSEENDGWSHFYYWNIGENQNNSLLHNLLSLTPTLGNKLELYVSLDEQYYDMDNSEKVTTKRASTLTMQELDKYIGDFTDLTFYYAPVSSEVKVQNDVSKIYDNSLLSIRIYKQQHISALDNSREYQSTRYINSNTLLSPYEIMENKPEGKDEVVIYYNNEKNPSIEILIGQGKGKKIYDFNLLLGYGFPLSEEKNLVIDPDIKTQIKYCWGANIISPKIVILNKKPPTITLTLLDDEGKNKSVNLSTEEGKGYMFEGCEINTNGLLVNNSGTCLKQLRLDNNTDVSFGEAYCIQQPSFFITSPLQKNFAISTKTAQNYIYNLTAIAYFRESNFGDNFAFINEFKQQFKLRHSVSDTQFIDYDILSMVERDPCCYTLTAQVPFTREENQLSKYLELSLYDSKSGLKDGSRILVTFTELEKLQQPLVYPQSPAVFVSGSNAAITIPFEYNQEVGRGRLRLKLFDMNNQSVLEENYVTTDAISSYITSEGDRQYQATFYLESSMFTIGEHYKAALAIESSSGAVSPWSNLTVFKVSAYPLITRASWLRDENFVLNDKIYYSHVEDKTESLKSIKYSYILYSEGQNIFKTPEDEILLTSDNGKNYFYELQLKSLLDFKEFRDWCKNPNDYITGGNTIPLYVNLQADFVTKNGQFSWQEPGDKNDNTMDGMQEKFYLRALNDQYYDYYNFDNSEQYKGYNTIVAKTPANPSAQVVSDFSNWRIYNNDVLIAEQSKQHHNTRDLTALYGNQYDQFMLSLNRYNNWNLYFKTKPILCDFDGQYLIDVKNQIMLNISYNNAINSLKYSRPEQKTDTIGSQYPVFFRNPYTNYREFPLSGTISYQSLVSFGDEESIMKLSDLGFNMASKRIATESDKNESIASPHLNLTGDNLYAERVFREKVIDFLSSGKLFLYKSQTEGNIVVRLMNISLTPKKELGRMLYDFSCTCYEAQDLDSYLKDCRNEVQ